MGVLGYQYLGPEVLAGFDNYKYSCKDTSPLSNYVMHPFWNQTVKLCPRWVAPNLLTLVGFLCCIGHWLLLAIWDYDYRAGTAPPSVSHTGAPAGVAVPGWVWVVVAVLLFLSHTLDGIDGKQARRTGTSTPLGELFDHGLDSWATVFITGAIYSVFGRNDDGFSISVCSGFISCISYFSVFIFFFLIYSTSTPAAANVRSPLERLLLLPGLALGEIQHRPAQPAMGLRHLDGGLLLLLLHLLRPLCPLHLHHLHLVQVSSFLLYLITAVGGQ